MNNRVPLQDLFGDVVQTSIALDSLQNPELEQEIRNLLAKSSTAQAVLGSVRDTRCFIHEGFFPDSMHAGFNLHSKVTGAAIPVINPKVPVATMASTIVHETRHSWQREQGLLSENLLQDALDIRAGLKRKLFTEADAVTQEISAMDEAGLPIHIPEGGNKNITAEIMALHDVYKTTAGSIDNKKRAVFDSFFRSGTMTDSFYAPMYLNEVHEKLQQLRDRGYISGMKIQKLNSLENFGKDAGSGNYLEGGRTLNDPLYSARSENAESMIKMLETKFSKEIDMVRSYISTNTNNLSAFKESRPGTL